MPKLSRTVAIQHAADDVFELVADIGRYPEFIRWIRTMKITNKKTEGMVRSCRGEAAVGFKGFSESFATDVIADASNRTITVDLADGPFRHLRNRWLIKPDGQDGSLIDFFIDYEFRNPMLSLIARANTNLAVNKIMSAFKAEADRRYGMRSS